MVPFPFSLPSSRTIPSLQSSFPFISFTLFSFGFLYLPLSKQWLAEAPEAAQGAGHPSEQVQLLSLTSGNPSLVQHYSNSGRSAPRPAAHAPSRKPPSKPAASAPPPAPVQSGNGFGSAIADGLGWGAGMVVAHRAVDSIFGPRVIQHETVTSSEPTAAAPAPNMKSVVNSDACGGQSKALSDCLSNFGSDISKCQFYMDMLQECRRGSGAA